LVREAHRAIFPPMVSRPTGTVTFLLTDVEGSTRTWEAHPGAMAEAMGRHDAILRGTIEALGGYVFSTAGDAFAAAFVLASDAVRAAIDVQRALMTESWPSPIALRVRIGLHTGEAVERQGDYFGPTVNRAARIMAAGHGGQILASSATRSLLDVTSCILTDLGEHQLRDLEGVDRLVQVGAEDLPATFPPLRTAERYATTLPAQRSTFIGRDDECRRVAQLLGSNRLVTLTGVGGTGKTRLAIEVAHAQAEAAPDGVFFVDLTRIADGSLVWQVVASGIDFVPDSAVPAAPQVMRRLRARRALLLVDNCEHVIDDAATAIDEILAACPSVLVLATSREALGIDGERVHAVQPLSTEAAGGRESPAVRLFLERATASDAPALVPADVTIIQEICARLDGLPLAIELAAARLGLLAPAEILARLEDRFRLLTGGRRGKRSRQRTLEETIAWSYDALDERERALLRQLSVFPAAFDLSRASAVAARDDRETLTGLEGLVARSLVRSERSGSDRTRYRLLETIREYAQARLVEAGDGQEVRRRHVIDTTERMEVEGETAWLVTTAMEELQDDVLVALDRADGGGEHHLLSRLAAAARDLFGGRGLLEAGRAWVKRALEVAPAEGRGALLVTLAAVEMVRGNYVAMARNASAARPLLTDSPRLEALALFHEILYASYTDPASAAPYLTRARQLLDGGLPRHHAAGLLLGVGGHYLWVEEDDAAIAAFDEGRRIAPAEGTVGSMTTAGFLIGLVLAGRTADIDRFLRDKQAAEHRRAWREHARRGEQWGIAGDLAVATAMASRGDVTGARRLVADVHLLLGPDRVPNVDVELLATLATIRLHDGDGPRAHALLTDALWAARTPAATALAYRTLATAAGIGTRDTTAWRSQEIIRRYATDHATCEATARRMLTDELASLGLVDVTDETG
jgi:predicted ATPase/class 3 adenylate cyclase